MTPNGELFFGLNERRNVFTPKGYEWALSMQIVDSNNVVHGNAWTIETWDKKPSDAELDRVKQIAIRSMEFYHAQIKLPHFSLK